MDASSAKTTVVYFTTTAPESRVLIGDIQQMLDEETMNFYVADRSEEPIESKHFFGACLSADLVIVDTTREEDGSSN